MRRYFVQALVLIYGFSNAVSLYSAETNYWEERRRTGQRRGSAAILATTQGLRAAEVVAAGPTGDSPSSLAELAAGPSHRVLSPGMQKDWGWLPDLVAGYGDIREIHVAPRADAPVVIHLQDVHEVEEAQNNLAGLVESLRAQRGISLVGLEGALGSFELDFFREGPLDVRKKLSDRFLNLGYLTGPEVAGIVAEEKPTLWGLEDLALYRGHVDAFEKSESGRAHVRQSLAAFSAAADKARETFYSPSLRALDDHRRAYMSHKESLGDYVPALWSALAGDKKAYPQVAMLVKLLAQERTLDFKEVERQRVKLAEALAQRLEPNDLDRLVKVSLAYRAGRQTAGTYQKYVATVCRQNDIRLDTFGPLAAYMDYVQGADPLDSGKLLDELDRLELAALTGLAETSKEKKLVDVFRGLALLDKLTNHGLTPQEWGVLKKEDLSLENIRSVLTQISPTFGSNTVSLPDLSPYKEFCLKAEQRNNALVKNLLAKMKTDKVNLSVLVAGGFHTDGMTALLKEANASYVVITPKISKVPDTRPLDIFVRAPLPLEKLLAGDVIHLAYPCLTQNNLETIAAAPNAPKRRDTLFKAWLLSLKNGKEKDGKSTTGLMKGVRSALTVVPLTGLLKEIRFFVPSVLGVLAGEFLTSTLGLTGGPIVHVLVGLTAAILYWPKFRDHHGSAEARWLAENPGTTSSDYRRNLFIAYGLISLVTVGAMVLVPALGVWLVEAQGPITLFEETGRAVGSIVVGGFLFHGIYNFVGRLFGGSRFVPAMADIRDSENDPKRDLDWCENQIRPNQFNAYSALMGSVIESLLKSDEGKMELVEKVPRLLAKLMDLVRENSYFEILPALKMMERLMEVSVQLDLQNGQSLEDLLRPSLTEILYRELSSPLYSDAHLIALLRFSLRVGVDPALCSRVTVQRLVASDWFVDRFLTEIRTGGIEQAEAESLLGVTANVDGEPNPGGPDSSLESREAQEKISQVLAVVRGEKEWERPVNEFRQATDPDVRRVIAQRLERLFHNALDLLRAVHRDEQSVVEALAQLVPSLSRLSPTGFSNSLFITTGFLSSLVNNLSSMGSLLGRDITDEWDDLSKMRPVVPIGSGQSQVEILGYSFPAILASWMKEESLAVNPAPKSRSEFAVVSADESKPLDHQFQKLVAARKRLLAMDERGRARFASLAGGAVTRADAESLLVIVGKMVDAFNRLGEKNGLPNSTLPPVWERLEQTIQDGIGSLRPEDVVSSQIQHLILDLPRPAVQWEEVGTLHQALNFMHQKGKQLFAEAAGLARVNTIVKVGHVAVTVANLSGNPIESNGVFVNRELRQVLRALEKPGSGPTAEVVLDNKFLKGSVALGVHSVEFLASIAPPENGGGIKVSFLEWRPKEGNIMRLAFIQAVLTKLGFKTEVRNEMYLNGTLDIQSGAFSQEQIEKALYLLVRVLYFTPDLNLMFDHVIGAKCKENGMDRAEAYAATQGEFSDLADVFLAEESIPFFLMDDPQYAQRLDHAYQTYKAKEPERNRVRKLLNNRLVRCGLSPIPETIPFGQGVIQSYYTEPLMSALAKGEIRVEAEGPVRNRNYRPIEDLARESLDRGDELMRMAAGLNGLMADLAFHPIGAVGELIAEECILIVGSGDRLVVRGLADPDSRQLVYATASLLKGDQRVRRLTLEDLGELLNAPEITQGLGEALRRSRKSISEKRLRGKPREETMPGLVHRGRPISSGTGSVVGVATFDRTFQEKAGARADHVLVVDFTTPTDFDAMKGSLATLTTLGNPETHSAITLRELHHSGVIFRGARWVTRNGKRALSVPVDRPHKPFQGEQGLWITPGVDVQDHLVEEGSVLLIDGERGVVSMLSGGWVEAVYTKWRDFKENRASAQEVVSFVRSFNNWDVLELFLFLAVFNDGLEETQRARVIALLEESVVDSSADDRDRFSEAKIKYLQLAVEKTDKDLAWLAEKFRGASTFNHIAASFKQIQNKILSLEGLANLLSLVAPRSADLSDFNSEIKTKEKKLRDQSLKELSKWDRKKATIADLPAIRFVLRGSQLNGVPLNNKSFQRLVKKERALTDDKRKQIRKEKAWVYALDKVDRDFTKEVGGKFSNLGESEPLIRQEGAFVPRALAITSHAFDSFLVEQGIHLEYHELASELDGFYESDSTRDSEFYGQVQAVSQEMRDAIESHSIDENGNLGKRLRMDLESAGLENAALILRSSGDMEDNNNAAFAGGARSFSNVNRINLLQMIPKVWASFWLSRGVAYRAHKKMKQKDARLAVIIQELIRGEMSGVMMTANPNSGEDSIVITAGYGLNEGIENNQVECDEYVVRKSDGELIANPTIPQKQKKVVANPTGEGTILVDVPPEDQKRQVLSADQIKWLVRVGNALQTHYGHPRNVEYTFVGGKLAILQDRAITTINEGLSPRGGKESKQRQSRWGSLISLLVLIITFGVFNFHKDANAIESLNSSPGEEASQLVETDQGLSENSQQEELNADQNGDSPSPALVYLNNLNSSNRDELWSDVEGWAREIVLGTKGSLDDRVMILNPLEAYVLMDVLSRPDRTMPVDTQHAAQVRAQLWVTLMAGFKAEFDQGIDRNDEESPYGSLTLLAFFGDGFGQKAFIDYAVGSGQWHKFFGMVPDALKGHVSAVARKVSPALSASPLGLLPLIGRPVYNFLIHFGVNPRLAAGIAGFVEQGVLALIAGGLAWLLGWIFGVGFVWGLIVSTAIIWKMFPKAHGGRVFVYEYMAGWRLKLVEMTADHLRSLRRASYLFFGSFLVITLVPVIAPLLGFAVSGSLEQWFFAGATISSLFHGLRNSIKPTAGKVAAMGSVSGRGVQSTNDKGINQIVSRNEQQPHSRSRTTARLLESEEVVSGQFIPLLVEEYRFLPREPGSVRAWKFTNFIELLRHYFWDGKSPVSVVDLGADSDVFMGNLKIKIPISNNLAIDISPRRGSSVVQADGGSWSELSKVSPDVESTDLVVINHIDHRGLSMLGNAWGLVRLGGLLMVTVAESDLMSANGDTPTAVEMVLSRLPEEARSVAQVVITKNLDYPRSSNDLSPALLIVAQKPIGPPNESGESNDHNAVEIQRTLLGGKAGTIIPVTAHAVSIDALRKRGADDRQSLVQKRNEMLGSLGLGTDVSEETIAGALARGHGSSGDEKSIKRELELLLAPSLVGLDGETALNEAIGRITQIIDAYHVAQGLFDFEKALDAAIADKRDISLELTISMVRGDLKHLTLAEKAQWDRLKRLAQAASKGELQKPVRLVIPPGVAQQEVETILHRAGAGTLVGNISTKPKSELALAEGKYSLRRFVDWVRGDKEGMSGPIEMYLMSRNDWDWDSLADEIRRNVRLLVDILPGLVMDATRGLPEGLKRIVVVNMSA